MMRHRSQKILFTAWNRINKMVETMSRPLAIDENPYVIDKNINLVRILIGLGIFHSYLDIFGFSPLLSVGDFVKGSFILILSFLFSIGFLTPVVGGLLIGFIAYPVVYYLGTIVLVMVLWALFFLGAGRQWSVDSLLIRSNHFRPIINTIYSLAFFPNSKSLGRVRFFALFLFWGVCVQAMVFHFKDYMWINADTLQILFLSPYWTDHYLFIRTISKNFPLQYDLFCGLALLVQTVWEMSIIPLMYFSWGRLFILIQGGLFFFLSLLVINLGYLPYYEICFWILLFNYSQCLYLKKAQLYYDDKCNLCKKTVKFLKWVDFYDSIQVLGLSKAPPEVQKAISTNIQIVSKVDNRLYKGFDAYRIICTKIFPFIIFYPIFALGQVTTWGNKVYDWVAERRHRIFGVCEPYTYTGKMDSPLPFGRKANRMFILVLVCAMFITVFIHRSRIFGQASVNVINETDLVASSVSIVLVETERNGEFKRIVPFMDVYGGRLDYLRNDLLYFKYSLPWQRNLALNNNFTNESPPKLTDFTIKLIKSVGMLDACLEDPGKKHFYNVNFYRKHRKRNRSFEYWSEPEKMLSYLFVIGPEQTQEWGQRCFWTYSLPPGHYLSDYRTELTENAYKGQIVNTSLIKN